MKQKHFFLKADDNTEIFVYHWLPDDNKCKGIVHIIHGMAEYGERYVRFAGDLTDAHYGVYAQDLRGHGKTVKHKDECGYLGKDISFDHLISDIHLVVTTIRGSFPGLPMFMFGHSLGSMIALRYCEIYGETISGALFSGIGIPDQLLLRLGGIINKMIIGKFGDTHKSRFVHNLAFGKYNKPFKPNRTEFDWLTRNNDEVDAYVKDPSCGFICTCSFFDRLSDFLLNTYKRKNLAAIPKELSIYICSGDQDPNGNMGNDIPRFCEMLKATGVKDVTYILYPGARHELLNETNRDNVIKNILLWLTHHTHK